MKYWKRITDAGCPDSASACDRKRALDPRKRRQRGKKKREREKERAKKNKARLRYISSLSRRISPIISPSRSPRNTAIQIISRQRAKSHYEATRHPGDTVAKIVAGDFSPRGHGSREKKRERRGTDERKRERKDPDSGE